jgi:hypothetical protein
LLNNPSGIPDSVAEVLDRFENVTMRNGFHCALYNSRGAHYINPNGSNEKDLANRYIEKAIQIEDSGYVNLSSELRKLSNQYIYEADWVAHKFGESD